MRRLAVLVTLLASVLARTDAVAAVERGTSRRIGESADPITAAVEISQATWEDGAATVVALGRSDLFPDSLAGAALAGTDGPVLFTTGGPAAPLSAAVRTEIQRVLPDPAGCDGSSRIAVLGGTGAVSTAAENELRAMGFCVERFGGSDRVATALLIARDVLDGGGDASRVIVSRSDDWPDSATGSAFAAAQRHPIVVTPPSGLDHRVTAFLTDVGPEEIVLLGGTAALSTTVEAATSAIASTRRVGGTSRDATAIAIAEQLTSALAPTGVALVNGFVADGWAHAIAGAVPAAIDRVAELYVDAETVPASVEGYLATIDDTFTIAIGPTSRVGDAVTSTVRSSRGIAPPTGARPRRYLDPVFTSLKTTSGVTYRTATGYDGRPTELQLNVYEPAGDTADLRPAVLWMHGGGWAAGNRSEDTWAFDALSGRGFVVVSASYRLVPPPGCNVGTTPDCAQGVQMAFEDAQAAVAYMREHAADLGIDPDRIAAAGFSAGAINAMNIGWSNSEGGAANVAAVVSLSGYAIDPVAEADPGDAPAILFNARDDPIVRYDQAESDETTAAQAGVPLVLRTYDAGGHLQPFQDRANVFDESARFLWWQLDLENAER